MNKTLIENLENIIKVFIGIDFKSLLSIILIGFFFFLIHDLFNKFIYKYKIKKISNHLLIKQMDIDFQINLKKLKDKYLFITIFIFIIFFFKSNINALITSITILSAIFLVSIRNQLNNIFLGIIYKSNINTTVFEKMEFAFKETPNDICKIRKINLFKTIYKNKKNGMLYSIENQLLNSSTIIHKPFRKLNEIQFSYIVDDSFDLEFYSKIVYIKSKKLLDIYKIDKDYLYNLIVSSKYHYKDVPLLKNNFDLEIKYLRQKEIEIILTFNLYNYKYKNYTNDFLDFRPKIINYNCEDKQDKKGIL